MKSLGTIQIRDAKIALIQITPQAEKHIEFCARFCYNSLDKMTDDSHVRFLRSTLKRGHFSILSHAHATFMVENVSRACSHQLVRHAHLRYLQKSQRYCLEEDFKFIVPPDVHLQSACEVLQSADHTAFDVLEDSCYTGWDNYKQLLKRNIKREDARYSLTNACATNIVISGTLQGWWDFLRLRLDKHAQWEIRMVAQAIYQLLNQQCPHIFNTELLIVQPKLNLDFPEEEEDG